METGRQEGAQQVVWTRGALTPEKKQVIVAIDHGLSFPDMPGLERPGDLIGRLARNPMVDGLIAAPGIYRQAARWGVNLSNINRLITVDYLVQDGANLTAREMFIAPEDAAAYDVDCYKMFFNVYSDKRDFLKNVHDFSRFASAGKRLNVSCLAEVLFFNNSTFNESPKTQKQQLWFGCRTAIELGADALKIPMIDDQEAIFEIIERLNVPTFILGGAKADGGSFIAQMHQIAKLPISGVMLGRNIWQSTDMDDTIAKVAGAIKG